MKLNKRIVMLFAIFLFLFGACSLPISLSSGGGDETTPTPTADETTPTATSVGKMSSPTGEESVPVATATATEAATATAETEAVPESASMEPTVASGNCYNPYYPVLPDTTWHYRTTTASLPAIEQYFTYDQITEDSFVSHQRIEGETTTDLEAKWECTPDGLLNNTFALISFIDLPAEFSFDTVEHEGVTLPPAEDWVVGKEWTGTWHIQGEADLAGVGTTTSDIQVVQDNQIAAVESVTVPAGTYDQAYRVDSTIHLELTTTVGNTTVPGVSLSFDVSAWYVEGVGLVKQASTDSEWNFEMQLIEMQ